MDNCSLIYIREETNPAVHALDDTFGYMYCNRVIEAY
jgi:hypothetical protein